MLYESRPTYNGGIRLRTGPLSTWRRSGVIEMYICVFALEMALC